MTLEKLKGGEYGRAFGYECRIMKIENGNRVFCYCNVKCSLNTSVSNLFCAEIENQILNFNVSLKIFLFFFKSKKNVSNI